ncbi:MAG: bifunctional phosphoribosyl-AMP cyclohydrolase/phosphoribosyl-ATP diphosphatase HisIE [Clostridia bacterium]|nr:bifunctional phosphoribosyl-AMP cyclohydrolase/phosphoribosyl-ATP diphosphatase HisIE [Clostridia bacterium]
MINPDELKFDENGLIPAVVTDYYSKKVLTLAYMSRESLEISIKEGQTCFYSRSRKTLWRKGETSGNTQKIVNIYADCDKDALTVEVIKKGPACHLGSDSCFTEPLYLADDVNQFSYDGLYDMLVERKETLPENSYTSYLFREGTDKIIKKIGEESTEVIVAAKGGDREEIIFELADLIYHYTVLMVNDGISPADVSAELAKRHIIDKKVKQKRMQ